MMPATQSMTRWRCPKCDATAEAIGSQAWHRCPVARRDVQLKREDNDDA